MSERVKVLLIIGQLEVGGTERQLLNILPEIGGTPLEFVIYALRGGGSLNPAFLAAGIRVVNPTHHSRRWLGLIRTAAHLIATLRAERPRIVHYFLPEAYVLGGLCSFLAPPCIRLMSRRSLNNYQQRWIGIRSVERFLHRRMDGILANSKAVLSDLQKEGVSDNNSCVIYNGVAVAREIDEETKASKRAELGLEPDCIVLIMVANLIHYKGHADVFDALAKAYKRLKGAWTLLLVGGDHGIQSDLEQHAVDVGIDAHIRWLGRQSDVQPFLAVADIALQASHEEGFSNAVLEAMAAGLPVVVTAVGGNVEAVVNGKTGIVVPPRGPSALAAAIIRMANNADLRRRMARAGQQQILRQFSIGRCADAHRRLYLGLARGEHSSIESLVGTET